MSKILFVTNTANKIGSFSIASIKAAQSAGMEFHMAASWNLTRDELDKLQNEFNVKLHHIDLDRSPYSPRNREAYKQLVRIIREEKIDYIHCNTPTGGILGRLAGKKCKVKKVIYQAHGFHFYKGASKKNWLIYYPVEKWLAKYTDTLITINREDFEFAKSKLRLRNGGKTYYVPGVGIDLSGYLQSETLRGDKRAELGVRDDSFVIISAGELNENKNNRVIISAIGRLKRNDIYYFLCGVGDQEEALRKQAEEAGLSDNVRFLGYRNDIKELYGMSDCFVMPSFREGLSRSIMEAMASGLPCIVSRIRGNVDLIEEGKGGYLCDVNDVAGYAEKMNILADDAALRRAMSEYNLINIRKFSTEVVTEEILGIYKSELGE